MAIINNLEEGQGIRWTSRAGFGLHGIVVRKTEESVGVVCVQPAMAWTKCYDDPGATWENDRNRVRLKDCPPPFTSVCQGSIYGKCYADADLSRLTVLDGRRLSLLDVEIVDNGEKVSERDMEEILCHPWHGVPEKELVRSETAASQDRYRQALGAFGDVVLDDASRNLCVHSTEL